MLSFRTGLRTRCPTWAVWTEAYVVSVVGISTVCLTLSLSYMAMLWMLKFVLNNGNEQMTLWKTAIRYWPINFTHSYKMTVPTWPRVMLMKLRVLVCCLNQPTVQTHFPSHGSFSAQTDGWRKSFCRQSSQIV